MVSKALPAPTTRAFPLPEKALTMHTIALAKTRAGKSSVLRLIVEHGLEQGIPVCIIDPKGDWWGIKSSADGKRAGYPVVIFGGEHADVPINRHAGKPVAELIATGNRPALIDLGGWMPAERTEFFIDFASTFFRITRGRRWLVVDECHNFAPQTTGGKSIDPQAGKMLHWANRLASEGAGKGVTLFSASQRPQKVAKDYVTSHDTLIALRNVHPLDRKAVTDWMAGVDPAKAKEIDGQLAELERGQGWAWSPEAKFGPKRIQFPLFSTFDSFAAPTGADNAPKLKGWAEVDLDEVREKLAAVVEEAKASDPRALKAENEDLKRKLAAAEQRAASPSPNAQAADAIRREAFAEGAVSREPEIAAAHRKGFEEAAEQISRAAAALTLPPAPLAKPVQAPAAVVVRARPVAPSPTPPPPHRGEVRAPVELGDVSGSQMKIVEALAFWESLGIAAPTRDQVAGAAGFAPSGTFRAYVGKLVGAGLIENAGVGALRLTDYGRNAAPPVDVSRSARQRVGQIISASHARILDAIPQDGSPISREELAAAAGFEPSGTFRAYLGKLNTLGIVRNAGVGFVAVEPWVWS